MSSKLFLVAYIVVGKHNNDHCGRWGRATVDSFLKSETPMLIEEDVTQVMTLLAQCCPYMTQQATEEVCRAIAWLPQPEHIDAQKTELTDLRLEETEESHQHVESLLRCVINNNHSLIEALMDVRKTAIQRQYVLYSIAAKSYFKFFATVSSEWSKLEAPQTTAALRLVRLVVKHATQLRPVFERAFAETPTTPWKAIIPQLFARLSHSAGWVRESISDLLCRLAVDSPHLIVVPAVVGSNVSRNEATTTNISDMLAKYFHLKDEKSEPSANANEFPVEEEAPFDIIDDEVADDGTEFTDDTRDDDENREVMHNCFNSLVSALTKKGLSGVVEAEMVVLELRRITVLWDELWLGTLTQHQADLARKFTQLKQEADRLEANSSLTADDKEQLIKTKYEVIFKPLLMVLEQLWALSSGTAETPHERKFKASYGTMIREAVDAIRKPHSYLDPSTALEKLRDLQDSLQQLKNSRRSAGRLKMSDISPQLAELRQSSIAMPGVLGKNGQNVCIHSVDDDVTVLPSKTKPKKLSFRGDDGYKYTYLFKGLEDLHLDERIMQFLSIVNSMLSKEDNEGMFRAHHYSVVPLGPRSGLIQWVDNATPLFGLYMRWQQREAQATAYRTNSAPQVVRPSDLFYQKLTPRLKAAGVNVTNRKEWPLSIMKEVMQELMDETPSDLLSRELIAMSPSAAHWWRATRKYNISSAVMSMVGFVIGLGDRHLDNLLVKLSTGEVVHIDYNVCFEKGKYLRVPEQVPFRMTQNIENALGVTGVEGVFRSSCEQVLSTMREGREVLLTLLETFIYDPLVDWTHDADAGYAGAMYGGNAALASSVRERRQRMERSLTVTMFRVRTKEMSGQWQDNRDKVYSSLEQLAALLETVTTDQISHQNLLKRITSLKEQIQYLTDTNTETKHLRSTLVSRHKENCKNQADIEAAQTLLKEAQHETEQMVNNCRTAIESVTSTENSMQLDTFVTSEIQCDVTVLQGSITGKSQKLKLEKLKQASKEFDDQFKECRNVLLMLWPGVVELSNLWQRYPATHYSYHPLQQYLKSYNSLLQEPFVQLKIQQSLSENNFDLEKEDCVLQLFIKVLEGQQLKYKDELLKTQTACSTILYSLEKQRVIVNELRNNSNITGNDEHRAVCLSLATTVTQELSSASTAFTVSNNTAMLSFGSLVSNAGLYNFTEDYYGLAATHDNNVNIDEVIHLWLVNDLDETEHHKDNNAIKSALNAVNTFIREHRVSELASLAVGGLFNRWCSKDTESVVNSLLQQALTPHWRTQLHSIQDVLVELLNTGDSTITAKQSRAVFDVVDELDDGLQTLIANLPAYHWLHKLYHRLQCFEDQLGSVVAVVKTVPTPPAPWLQLHTVASAAAAMTSVVDCNLPIISAIMRVSKIYLVMQSIECTFDKDITDDADSNHSVISLFKSIGILNLSDVCTSTLDDEVTEGTEDLFWLTSCVRGHVSTCHQLVATLRPALMVMQLMQDLSQQVHFDEKLEQLCESSNDQDIVSLTDLSLAVLGEEPTQQSNTQAVNSLLQLKLDAYEQLSHISRCKSAEAMMDGVLQECKLQLRALHTSTAQTRASNTAAQSSVVEYVDNIAYLEQQCETLKPMLEKLQQLKTEYFTFSSNLSQKMFAATDASSDLVSIISTYIFVLD